MADLRDYLAAERTFLAWLRTGLALMGFGFVVARFGLFLQQLAFLDRTRSLPSSGISLWIGTILIAAGILVSALSALRHVRIVRRMEANQAPDIRSSSAVIAIATFLALIGLAMAVYLLTVRWPGLTAP
jgi:putative membrane protein